MNDHEPMPELDARLARDAARWSPQPSAAARAALRARLDTLAPRPAPGTRAIPRWLLPAAAAAVLASLLWFAGPGEAQPAAARPAIAPVPLDARVVDLALAPLRSELHGLEQDGRALARSLWRQVPEPVRRLIE